MTEPCRHRLDIAPIRQQHRRRRVPQAVKFQMPNPVPLQKMIELLRRRVRMHHVTVLLGEDVVEKIRQCKIDCVNSKKVI